MKKILLTSFYLFLGLTIQLYAQESYQEITTRFNAQLEKMREAGSIQSKKGAAKSTDINIMFTLDHALVTNDGINDHLEFDINIKSDASGAFFSNALFRIDYSGSGFGINTGANGNIELTYGPLFNDLNTYEPDLYMDVDTHQVALIAGIRFAPLSGTFNRVETPQTYVQLLHVKMKIENCSQEIALTFHDDLASLPNLFWTYNEASDGDFFSNISFENTTFEDKSKLKENPLKACTITDIATVDNEATIELFPNPAEDYLKIYTKAHATHFVIINRTGEIVLEGNYLNNKNILDISNLESGHYIIKTTTGSDISYSQFCKL